MTSEPIARMLNRIEILERKVKALEKERAERAKHEDFLNSKGLGQI